MDAPVGARFPFALKLLGGSYLATALPLLIGGFSWWASLLAAIFISPFLATPWGIASRFLFGPLTTICRKPALLWYLHTLRKALSPASRPSLDGSQEPPSAIGGGFRRVLLTTVHRGTFVQVSLQPTPENSGERLLFPSFARRAKCRLMIGSDTTSYWEVSQAGRFDLTCEEPRDYSLGDAAFDVMVQLTGPLPHALAVLTPQRCRALLALLGDRWQEVSLQCKPPVIQLSPASNERPPARLPPLPMLRQTIDALVDFVAGLSIAEADLVPALLRNTASEPSGLIRRRMLEALTSLKPEPAQLDQAIALASRDEDPWVRSWAAKQVGGEWGLEVMGDIAKKPQLGFTLRMEAVRQLLATWPAERIWPALELAYRHSDASDRPTVLTTMLDTRDEVLLGYFAKLLKRWDPALSLDAIFQLGSCGQPFVENALLDLLADEKLPVRLAALQALGASGTRRVLPLLFDLTSDQQLHDGAEGAIRRIQAREQIGDAGQLSLAGPDPRAGAVSLAEQPGALALVEKQKDEV